MGVQFSSLPVAIDTAGGAESSGIVGEGAGAGAGAGANSIAAASTACASSLFFIQQYTVFISALNASSKL